ncbi:atlastin-1-like [Artemia franciscana]|uniref:atlastin-1-like n=1 Tax=Artemia franciscana TaxID=6661 RepID=UPI0032DA7950
MVFFFTSAGILVTFVGPHPLLMFLGVLNEIEESFMSFKNNNDIKDTFKPVKTPVALMAVFLMFFFFSRLFGVLGLDNVVNICYFIMGITLVLLFARFYIKFKSELSSKFRSS